MEAFFVAMAGIAVGGIDDKTQLLPVILAVPPGLLRWVLGLSFLAIAAWALEGRRLQK
jgi:putative Ca2+/H+ antiporter (TMEM165/GDT1 family)